MVTLNELMNYFNNEELFKNEDSCFEAHINAEGELELSGWDGIDDEEFFLTINKDFDIKLPSGSIYPFDDGDGYFYDWEDEDNPTVKEIADAVVNQIRFAYMLKCAIYCEKVFYFSNVIKANNICGHELLEDFYGRKWSADEKTIVVKNQGE